MDYQDQLKLQAYLDGELPETEARKMGERQASDAEAAALLGELRWTREALGGFEEDVRLPESREFYWSKIQREIQRVDSPALEAACEPLLTRLRRVLMPAVAIGLVAVAGLIASHGLVQPNKPSAEISLADARAFTYYDFSAGATLVWLSYPAEKEIAKNDAMDRLQ